MSWYILAESRPGGTRMAGGNSHQRAIENAARAKASKKQRQPDNNGKISSQIEPANSMVQSDAKWQSSGRWTLISLFGSSALGVVIFHANVLWIPPLTVFGLLALWWQIIRKPSTRNMLCGWTIALGISAMVALRWIPHTSVTQVATSVPAPGGKPDLEWTYGGDELAISTSSAPRTPGEVLVAWVGRIENRGEEPSTTSNWRLSIKLPGETASRTGTLLAADSADLSPWEKLMPPTRDPGFRLLTWSNYLPESTAEKAVAIGKPALGWVAFTFSSVPNGQLVAGADLSLSFDDELGTTRRIDVPLRNPLQQMPYIPGLFKSR
jgi:hypothetical protein